MIKPLPLVKVSSDFIIHTVFTFCMILANVLRNDRLVYLKNVISSVCSYKQNLWAYQPKIIVAEQNYYPKENIHRNKCTPNTNNDIS